MEMDVHGVWQEPVQILEKPYHLSYPFVFEWDGVTYMIPESVENRTIDLYECVDFPLQWKFKKTLMDGVLAVDSTLLRHQGKWWLFTGIARRPKDLPLVELHLFYAHDLLAGEWHSHPQNPIVPQTDCARPAGSLFSQDGRLIRPAQDCSKMYGYGVNFFEIVTLSRNPNTSKRKWNRSCLVGMRKSWQLILSLGIGH